MSKFTCDLMEVLKETPKVYFDCYDWTKEEKSKLQKSLFEEEFLWVTENFPRVGMLEVQCYCIDSDMDISHSIVDYFVEKDYTCINHLYKPKSTTKKEKQTMTKNVHTVAKQQHPKPPSTTRVTIEYLNGQTFTFSNCSDVVLNKEMIRGVSETVFDKVGVKVESISRFQIDLSELNGIFVRGNEGFVSSTICIEEGLVTSIEDKVNSDNLTKKRDFRVE